MPVEKSAFFIIEKCTFEFKNESYLLIYNINKYKGFNLKQKHRRNIKMTTCLLFVWYFFILPILLSGLFFIVVGGTAALLIAPFYLLMRYGLGAIFEGINKIPYLGRMITSVIGTAVGIGMIAMIGMCILLPMILVIYNSMSAGC